MPLPSAAAISTDSSDCRGTFTNDEELELPHLEQEETTHPVQSSPAKNKKPGENPNSPGSSPRNEPAASCNLDPNNPVNLPMHSDSAEELIPHVPTSSSTGSLQRTWQYTDQQDGESEDSQRTRPFDDQGADLVLGEAHWSFMTAEQKTCANTGSFTVPSDIEGNAQFDLVCAIPVSIYHFSAISSDWHLRSHRHQSLRRREGRHH